MALLLQIPILSAILGLASPDSQQLDVNDDGVVDSADFRAFLLP